MILSRMTSVPDWDGILALRVPVLGFLQGCDHFDQHFERAEALFEATASKSEEPWRLLGSLMVLVSEVTSGAVTASTLAPRLHRKP